MHYSVLYRGPLSSCNFGCTYCPFAKRTETHAELAGDRESLARFLDWCGSLRARQRSLSVLFTPWGEALIRPWYHEAIAALSQLDHVERVAIQTNISCHLKWIDRCRLDRVALWCTYHPTETTRERFLARCRELDARGVRYSVGVVGLKEHLDDARWLRERLSESTYLWVNAFKRIDGYYDAETFDAYVAIDPLFPVNAVRHQSRGRSCRAGESVFSVDGDGTMRRCHFVKTPIGNIYDEQWEAALRPTPCSADTCGCHIGYVHMHELDLYDVFAGGVLERIPASRVWRSPGETTTTKTKTDESASRRVRLPQVSASGAY